MMSVSVEDTIAQYGAWFYAITFIWTALEGETFVIIAGYAAHQGLLNPYLLVLFAWTGSFLGDQIFFLLGRKFGHQLLTRFPRWQPGVARALEMLKRYDIGFILSFRFIYGVRNFASFAMGMSPLPWIRFSALNFVAAGLWATSFVSLGYWLGEGFRAILGDAVGYVGLGLLAGFLFLMWFFISAPSRRAKRLARAAERAAEADALARKQADGPTG